MATERLTGASLPSNLDDPNNFGGILQNSFEGIAEFCVPSFADAGERDSVWSDPGPHNGAKCWLDSPAGFYSKYPAGWRPDAMPASGDGTTQYKNVVADASVDLTTPSDYNLLMGATFTTPSWARLFGGNAQLGCVLHIALDGDGAGGAGHFTAHMEWSLDGGSTWHPGTQMNLRGIDVTCGFLFPATDTPTTIDVTGITNIQTRIVVHARVSTGGVLHKVNGETTAAWTVSILAS